jgi:hypothetical protein
MQSITNGESGMPRMSIYVETFAHIQRLNVLLGLYNPRLVTPLEFLDDEVS